eukprot:2862791-Ditylum_brightwellii.AAC.1
MEQYLRESYRNSDYADIQVHVVAEGEYLHGSKDGPRSVNETDNDMTRNAIGTLKGLSLDLPQIEPFLRKANQRLNSDFMKSLPLKERINIQLS